MARDLFIGPTAFVTVLATVILGLPIPPTARAGESPPDPRTVFEQTALRAGPEYMARCTYLVQQGSDLLPLLREKSKSDDWRQRDLAKSLILRIEQPEKTALWDHVLRNGSQKSERLEDGTVLVSLPERTVGRLPGEIPRGGDVVLTRECVPFVLDKMRESNPDTFNVDRQWRHCLQVMRHFADAESSYALASHLGQYYREGGDLLKPVLLGIGTDAAPALRDVLRNMPPPIATGTTLTENAWRERSRSSRAAANAAEVLAAIGDREAVPLLIEQLRVSEDKAAITAFAMALGTLGDKAAVAVVFDRLLDCVEVTLGDPAEREASADYDQVRPAMIAFGDAARAFLAARTADDQPMVDRAVATGLLYEIDHPEECEALYRDFGGYWLAQVSGNQPREDVDVVGTGRIQFWKGYGSRGSIDSFIDVPVSLSLERAAAFATPSDLVCLAREAGNPLAYDVATAGLLTGRYDTSGGGPQVVGAFAAAGQVGALKVYERLLDEHGSGYEQSIVEAVVLLGDPRGAPLLKRIVDRWKDGRDHGPVSEIAGAVLPVVQGEQPIETLLDHPQGSIRLVAARRLARERDPRGFPDLFAAALASGGREHVELRDLIVGIGEKVVPLLDARCRGSEVPSEQVLCESLILRCERPDLSERVRAATLIRVPDASSRDGPSVAGYRSAGAQVADAVTKDAIPLLEASMFFSSDFSRDIAAAALATFKQPRSIPLLVESLRSPQYARGQNIAAALLADFGEAGVAAAKSIPPPDPDKAQFAARGSRYLGGTSVLGMAGDEQSVENILAATEEMRGLRETVGDEDYSKWRQRMELHLRLAAESDDKRLIEVAIRFVEHPDSSFAVPALKVLARHDDERVVAPAFHALRHKGESAERAALPVLVNRLKDEAATTILEEVKMATSDGERLPFVRSIGLLVKSKTYWRECEEPQQMLSDARKVFQPYLIEQLASKDAKIQAAASTALANYEAGDQESLAALIHWGKTRTALGADVIDYLERSGTDEAAATLLAVYRNGQRKSGRIAKALGDMQYVAALDDIGLALDERIKQRPTKNAVLELDALRSMRAVGVPKIIETLHADTSLHVRVSAAECVLGHQEAFDDVRDLLLEMASQGLGHPDIVRHSDPNDYYETLAFRLAKAFCGLAPERAYPILSAAVVRIEDDELARPIAQQLARAREDYLASKGIDLGNPRAPEK